MRYLSAFSAFFVFLWTSASYAADEKQAMDENTHYNWSGLYFGFHGGLGNSNSSWREGPDEATGFTSTQPGTLIFSHSPSGWLYGVTGGLNRQFDRWVIGIEGNWSQSSITTTTSNFPNVTFSTDIKSLWSVGPRLGLVHENALFYVEGGYVSAEIELDSAGQVSGAVPVLSVGFNSSENHVGHYFGGGIDLAITSNVFLGIEYNRSSFEDEIHDGLLVAGRAIPVDVRISDFTLETLTTRLGYRF